VCLDCLQTHSDQQKAFIERERKAAESMAAGAR
jgi:hypothetical protein